MISRRNIRIKVMQTLYSFENAIMDQDNPALLAKEGSKVLAEKIEQVGDTFALVLLYLTRVALYAETDANNKAGKYIPTESDLNTSTKIAGNTLLWQILENKTFSERVENANADKLLEADLVRKMYEQLIASEPYQEYAAEEARTPAADKKILLHLWRQIMLKNELLSDVLESGSRGWEEDQNLVKMLIDHLMKNIDEFNFLSILSLEKKNFSKDLFSAVMEKNEYLISILEPMLENWEVDRVASIDMILLKMGLCEFLYFPTIPSTATINEYIEIAKEYSTEDSGKFVNGILDKARIQLEAAGKIQKDAKPK